MISGMGLRIKSERIKLKLTQNELSEKVGVTGAYIGMIERGEKYCSLDLLVSISQVLNVSSDYLLTGNKFIVPPPKDSELKQLIFYLYHNIEKLNKYNIPITCELLKMLAKLLQNK